MDKSQNDPQTANTTGTQPDCLHELFRMQKALNQRIGVFTDNLSEDKQQEWLRQYCLAWNES